MTQVLFSVKKELLIKIRTVVIRAYYSEQSSTTETFNHSLDPNRTQACLGCALFIIGLLSLIGIGGLGIAGLLHFQVVSIPNSVFPFLHSILGMISHPIPVFIGMTLGGMTVGGMLTVLGAHQIYRACSKK
ncbi:MAG: hypothetical protein JSS62_04010 [Verrucomicrobia bacterium]|nr:hypothetical protein [Verrucomicrobiota bacterium]MBS0647064.1 hypothetical protein [Verrucomicrobiota bacterium]